MTTPAVPIKLGENRPPVYYAGGANISRFRGLGDGTSGPEDWVASLCRLPEALRPPDAAADCGVSRTPDGRSLAELVAADPQAWFGAKLAARHNGDPGLLVKLLDSGERLPVHCHPSRAFARRHLGSLFGKTEGWVIMSAAPGARVWVGMREQVDRADLRRWIDRQNVTAMLGALNEFPVGPGDVVYVPSGVPHSIGPGVFLTELQEPTSFSVLADHDAFGVDANAATLGLGWDLAVSCFDLTAYADRRDDLLRPPADGAAIESLFGAEADEFFRCLRVTCDDGPVELGAPGYGVLVALDGVGTLHSDAGVLPLAAGDTVVLPAAAGRVRMTGRLQALLCLPAA